MTIVIHANWTKLIEDFDRLLLSLLFSLLRVIVACLGKTNFNWNLV